MKLRSTTPALRDLEASGVMIERAQLRRRAIDGLGEGDVLMVTGLDRLARSTRDLLNTLDKMAKAGAGFRSLHDAWAGTTTPHGRLLVIFLGGLAEFERDLIRTRSDEGRGDHHARRQPHLSRHGRHRLSEERQHA
jgi:DNA invertase Pin-like site-specific DNA recombinase